MTAGQGTLAAAPSPPGDASLTSSFTSLDVMALVLLSSLWGASYLFIRVASPALGPILMVVTRLVLATAVLAALTAAQGIAPLPAGSWRQYMILGGLNAAAPFTLIAIAEVWLPASLTSILGATNPLFTAPIAALFLGDHLRRSRLVGLCTGIVGVVVVVGWSGMPFGMAAYGAAVLAVVSAACFASGAVYSRLTFPSASFLQLATMQQAAATLWMIPLALILVGSGLDRPTVTPNVVFAISASGVLSTALAYVVYFFLLQRVGPARTHTSSFLIPVFGVVWGCMFLGESITPGMVVGGLVTIAGLSLALSHVPLSRWFLSLRGAVIEL